MMMAAFHLYNNEAKRQLHVTVEERMLPFSSESTYLGIKLERALTFRHHLESLHSKLTSRIELLKRLTGSSWGASAQTLRTAALALIYSTAEYCVPVWCRSAHTHFIDKTISDAVRIVTGCLRPMSAGNLHILAGIHPSELCRKKATLLLARLAQDPEHLLHERLNAMPSAKHQQLKSRQLFVPAALELINEVVELNINAAHWADYRWNKEWQGSSFLLHAFIPNASTSPLGIHFPRPAWV